MSKQDTLRFIRQVKWVFVALAIITMIVMLFSLDNILMMYDCLFFVLGCVAMIITMDIEYARSKNGDRS